MSVLPSFLRRLFEKPTNRFGVVLLGIVLFLAYSNSFSGPFIFDDASSIDENPSIKSWTTVLLPPGDSGLTVAGRPIANLTIAINYALGGRNVVGYHVMNLGIHILATFVLFGLVRRALLLPSLRDRFGAHSWWLALAAAAVWGLHPLQTESVTYMIQRAESLVGLFYLLTMYLFIRSVEEPERREWKLAAVAACLLGMASKEVMVTAPVVIFLFDVIFVAGTLKAAWRARGWFYLALAATWGLLAWCIVMTGNRGATVGYNVEVNAWRYALTQCHAITHYLKLVFWPDPLVLDYGGPLAERLSDVAWRAGLLVSLVGGSLFLLWRRPRFGYLFFVFFVILSPTSSVVPVLTQTVAEHRMYLPLAPLVVLLVVSTGWLWNGRLVFFWLAVAVALGGRTYVRNHDYRSEEAIWTTVTEHCAYNIRGWNSLAMIHSLNGNLGKAKEAVEYVLRVRPDNPDALTWYGNILVKLDKTKDAEFYYRKALEKAPLAFEANHGLGILLLENKRHQEALECFKKALKQRPQDLAVRYNLGKAHVALNQMEDAMIEFRTILKRDPKAFWARNNLGNALLGLQRTDEAIKTFQDGLAVTPGNIELQRSLGLALISVGKPTEAIKPLEAVIALDAKDAKAHANLGLAFSTLGRETEACAHFEKALENPKELSNEMVRGLHVSVATEKARQGLNDLAKTHYIKAMELDPANPRLLHLLANLQLRTGAIDEAIYYYEQIVTAAPDFAEAQGELGLAYMETGRLSEARPHLETALRLQPENTATQEYLKRLRTLERR